MSNIVQKWPFKLTSPRFPGLSPPKPESFWGDCRKCSYEYLSRSPPERAFWKECLTWNTAGWNADLLAKFRQLRTIPMEGIP